MKRSGERGMVLVACLLILAILSLLGATSLFTASLDAQFVGNQKVNRETLYAAEAALEIGAGKVMSRFRNELRPFAPDYAWHEPSGAANEDPYANPYNGYVTRYRIANGTDPQHPDTLPRALPYSTLQNGQEILHFAYTYAVEGEAEGPNGRARLTETLRALETPLVQYYVFFQDDLSWHPGKPMTSWGRIHTNGDLYFAPQMECRFQNFNLANPAQRAPNQITVSGKVHYGKYLAQNGGFLSRAAAQIWVKLRNLATLVFDTADCNEITGDIDSLATMDPFRDETGAYLVRVGADRLPTVSQQRLRRGDFYEQEAKNPQKENVDGITILWENGRLSTHLTVQGHGRVDVTDRVREFEVAPGVPVNPVATLWNGDATTNANNAGAANAAAMRGTMVYAPEIPVALDMVGAVTPRAGNPNPRYPCVLERRDGREGQEVDLTVVDLQRLQYWYRDYLDYLDNGALDRNTWDPAVNPNAAANRLNPANRSLLIYVSRTDPNFVPTAPGAEQAVKVIGSRAGRTRGTTDRQSGPTLLTRTTLVTDNPLYLDGDFNAPGANGLNLGPGTFGCAILSDAVTLLSNRWGSNDNAVYPNAADAGRRTYGVTGTAFGGLPAATNTVYNAAFFTGRYNFRATPAAGEEAGIHNFVRFLENWAGATCSLSGCLINLWFSTQATGRHSDSAGYYQAPTRAFGWDVGFANPNYWPPYVPSIYTVERVAWRVDK